MQINSKSDLDAAIIELEKRKLMQQELMVEQFNATKESLRPINLVKEGFNNLKNSPDLPQNILKALTGIGVAVLSKKLLLGNSSSGLKKLLAGVVEFTVAKSAITNLDKVKAYGVSIYHNLFKKNSNHHPQHEEQR